MKGISFLNDRGQEFEITNIKCEIKREDGTVFSLDLETVDYLINEKLITVQKHKEGTTWEKEARSWGQAINPMRSLK